MDISQMPASHGRIPNGDAGLRERPPAPAKRISPGFYCRTKSSAVAEGALARGYRSSIAIPLSDTAKNVFGVFTLYAVQPNSFIPG